jgi:cytidine deaminase
MGKIDIRFQFDEFESINDLPSSDRVLLEQARLITADAYAPYSGFLVGAAARLSNLEIVTGTNQENASYPIGICAERTLLAAAGTQYPDTPITSMAISYHNTRIENNSGKPISPCGMCRQALHEFEERTGQPIRLILSGQEGKVWVIETSAHLLPLAFSGSELKG